MSLRLSDALRDHLAGVERVVLPDRAGTFTHLLAGLDLPVQAGRGPRRNELAVVKVEDDLDSVDRLREVCVEAPPGALIAAVVAAGGDAATPDALADALAGAGADLVCSASSVYPSYPVIVVVRRAASPRAEDVDRLVAALDACRVAPEEDEPLQADAPVPLDPQVRARLERLRAEAARLRAQARTSAARADAAEAALARLESSASLKVGRLLVEAAKRPRLLLGLPRQMWALWRLRASRRRGTAVTGRVPTAARELSDPVGTALLAPRLGAAVDSARLSVVAVVDDSTARDLRRFTTLIRVTPHDAAAAMAAADADLVLIDTAASAPTCAWAHLGDPSAADRERAALDLIDAAHDLGRPVVLLRSGDLSLSAGLIALSERCDLVLSRTESEQYASWSPGIDLADAWAAPGGARTGTVFVGDLSARQPRHVRVAVAELLRCAGESARIVPRTDVVTAYPVPWPQDLRSRVGRAVRADELTALLAQAECAVVTDGDTELALRARLAGARPIRATDPEAQSLLARGALDAQEHQIAVAQAFSADAAPVRLAELCRLLTIRVDVLAVRHCAVVAPEPTAGTVAALLRQTVRPHELVVPVGTPREWLKQATTAGIAVRFASDLTPDAIGPLVDAPIVVPAAGLDSWSPDHLAHEVQRHEIGMAT